MLHWAPLVLCLVWSGFVSGGLDMPLWGMMHWFGLLVVCAFWTMFAIIKGVFE